MNVLSPKADLHSLLAVIIIQAGLLSLVQGSHFGLLK